MAIKTLIHPGFLLTILMIVMSMTSSDIGRLYPYNAELTLPFSSTYLHSSSHSHSNPHSHSKSQNQLSKGEHQHDMSNHTHDNVILEVVCNIALMGLTDIQTSWRDCGPPIRMPFKIERPPKAAILAIPTLPHHMWPKIYS